MRRTTTQQHNPNVCLCMVQEEEKDGVLMLGGGRWSMEHCL
jgi:hypothetical protein